MKFENIENKCYIVDGKEVWDSRSIAVVGMILIEHNGNIYVLLVKRGLACPDEVGKFCMPCGYLDKNETCEEAVVREIWEESGLNIYSEFKQNNIIINNMNFPWKIQSTPNTPLQTVSMNYALFLKSELESLPKLTTNNNAIKDEVSETKWVNINNLDKYDIAFNHKSTIKIFVNNI